MVLDMDLFREDKGGDPNRVRANVKARFDDVSSVDKVIDIDNRWRKMRHNLDQLNKAKNQISKEYGNKMKQMRQNQGGSEAGDNGSNSVESKTTFDLTGLLARVNEVGAQDTLA